MKNGFSINRTSERHDVIVDAIAVLASLNHLNKFGVLLFLRSLDNINSFNQFLKYGSKLDFLGFVVIAITPLANMMEMIVLHLISRDRFGVAV